MKQRILESLNKIYPVNIMAVESVTKWDVSMYYRTGKLLCKNNKL